MPRFELSRVLLTLVTAQLLSGCASELRRAEPRTLFSGTSIERADGDSADWDFASDGDSAVLRGNTAGAFSTFTVSGEMDAAEIQTSAGSVTAELRRGNDPNNPSLDVSLSFDNFHSQSVVEFLASLEEASTSLASSRAVSAVDMERLFTNSERADGANIDCSTGAIAKRAALILIVTVAVVWAGQALWAQVGTRLILQRGVPWLVRIISGATAGSGGFGLFTKIQNSSAWMQLTSIFGRLQGSAGGSRLISILKWAIEWAAAAIFLPLDKITNAIIVTPLRELNYCFEQAIDTALGPAVEPQDR